MEGQRVRLDMGRLMKLIAYWRAKGFEIVKIYDGRLFLVKVGG